MSLLEVKNLKVEFSTYGGVVQAVRGVDFSVDQGKTLAIVGESGCGKSVTVQALMGLTPMPPGRITSGEAYLDGAPLLGIDLKALNHIRGRKMSMIFQDPMTSLNPTMKVGHQIAESLVVHKGMKWGAALKEAISLLDKTRIPEAEKRAGQYPFEFSGGMLQRAMIALALACRPRVLFADEPTTALDVTIQAQILELMKELQREEGTAIVLITHDLGVVAYMADFVAVMYAGQIVEKGSVDEIFYESRHPYTRGLRTSMPDPRGRSKLQPISGSPPDLFHPPMGCGFYERCSSRMRVCRKLEPIEFSLGSRHMSRCWLLDDRAPEARP